MAMKMELDVHSHGNLRCSVRDNGAYAVATLRDVASLPGAVDGVVIYLDTPAEIAAFKALSEALAAQDVVEERVA